MDFSSPSFNTIAALTLAILALLLYRSQKRSTTADNTPPPTAGGAWPVIGHLRLFTGNNNLPHVALGSLADKHGPIYTIQLGTSQAVVVNSWEIAKEVFTTHDLIVSTRPNLTSAKLLGYDMVMFGFAPYGAYWREMRKIVTLELLSHRRIQLLRHVRVSEVEYLVKELYQIWNRSYRNEKNGSGDKVVVELKRLFGDMTLNVILRMVAGKRYFGAGAVEEGTEARRCSEAIRGFFHYLGMYVMRDALPYLGWLDVGGYEKCMKRVAKELDDLLNGWLEEHRRKRVDGGVSEPEQDFMEVMLSVLHGENFGGHVDPDVVNKSACLNLIAGGTDTTTLTLTWAISLLLNHPNILEKAYKELDKTVGRQRLIKESDIPSLTYLQSIVKETLRLYPAAPLSGPRVFTQDCTLGGYHIQKGTQLITNIWKIQHDSRVWVDPMEFQPERFLGQNFDFKGRNYEYIPFGSGRRSCPGIAFGIEMVHLTLASFLHAFEISNPVDELIDMSESPGLTNMKATPLEVIVSPRLPPEVYG
ncbi:Demethylepipodophyllotoxin synthase [Linum perenne]